MEVNTKFWKNKNVFVSGQSGFKGSWLSLWLQKMDANVTGYANSLRPTEPSLFELAQVEKGMNNVTGDIRDYDRLLEAIRAARTDIVFHLAAQPLVRYGYANPKETYETNVMGTVNVLEAVRKAKTVRCVVVVTSDKCYKNREENSISYQEEDQMGGDDPYSSSKGCAELVTAAYRTSYFPPDKYLKHRVSIASVRAGNVVGGGDWAKDRLIPDLIRSLVTNVPVIIRNPEAIRPWQNVLEPLRGYLMLAEKSFESGLCAQAWNFGPADSDARSVGWVTNRVIELWGSGKWVVDTAEQLHEARYLRLDNSKAGKELNWKPKLTLDKALGMSVDWYRAFKQGEDMRKFTQNQITVYEEKINQ